MAKARRNNGRLALMFIDLDKFKPVNDTYGHGVGDLLLKEVAARMQQCVRESDTVSRIGGDEFVILLPAIEGERDASMVAGKVLHALSETFDLGGHSLSISSSIGIAIYPEHGDNELMLAKHADIAMYHAKHGGRNNARLYQPGMQEAV
ncbi:MAG: GGDEF domain-containing protein [Nitrosomonadales bacterium]|nr:GGDEF domain-containing protein [Nitrosomonadales bacterium]